MGDLARVAAARLAASAVLAGRSAALAVRGAQRGPGPASVNEVANRAAAAAALREYEASPTEVRAVASSTEADPAPSQRTRNESTAQGTTAAGTETGAESELCEWDITVQRTFITVMPMRSRAVHTVPG